MSKKGPCGGPTWDEVQQIAAAWEPALASVWREVDARQGARLGISWQTPGPARLVAQWALALRIVEQALDPRNPGDLALVEQVFRPMAAQVSGREAEDHIRRVQAMGRQEKRRVADLRRLAQGAAKTPSDGEPYTDGNAAAHNRELVTFVAERVPAFGRVLVGELGVGHRGPLAGALGDALSREWSTTHRPPWRQYRSGASLLQAYGRAIRRSVGPEFVRDLGSEVRAETDRQMAAYRAVIEQTARPPREHRAGSDDLSPRLHLALARVRNAATTLLELRASSPEEYEARQTQREEGYRASLTLHDLVVQRVRGLVWRPSDEGPETWGHLLLLPLRPWFLAEVRGEPMHLHMLQWESARHRGPDGGGHRS